VSRAEGRRGEQGEMVDRSGSSFLWLFLLHLTSRQLLFTQSHGGGVTAGRTVFSFSSAFVLGTVISLHETVCSMLCYPHSFSSLQVAFAIS
jgi:hypothetical protein